MDRIAAQPNARLARRKFLTQAGTALAAIPMIGVMACRSEATQSLDADSSPTSPTPNTENNESSAGSTSGELTVEGTEATAWAIGGTLAMTGNYADPFTEGLGTTCTLYRSSTLGPCYAETVDRKDISEGAEGLPARFAFLVVDSSCKPVSDAIVDIWHCSPEGYYSGDDANAMCTGRNADAEAARWFRGIQKTDASGRVDFDTCFPGWYASRTVHVHFKITVGNTSYLTSQLFFEDSLNTEIIATQVHYKERGSKDTSNAADKVIKESSLNNYYFQTKKMADGALLAYKTLVIRA